jgi:hypothetical protein
MPVTPNANVTPTKWNFYADPNYAWSDKGCEPPYLTDIAIGVDPADGSGGVWIYKDMYDKLGFLFRGQSILNSRGYKGYSVTDASATITPAQLGTILMNTNASTADVVYTLPSRALMQADGCEVLEQIGTSPGFQSLGGSHKTLTILGATNSNGHPLKIVVDQPVVPGSTPPGTDLQQSIGIENIQDQEIYLYRGEYAELIPTIIWTGASTDVYSLTWTVYVHRSNYGKVAEYVQMPDSSLGKNQLKSNGAAVSRLVYARLWQVLNNAMREDGSTPVYTVVSHSAHVAAVGKYGVGDGSTTLDLTDLTSLNNSAFFQYNIYY